jgi:hypothetical protein
LRCFAAKARDPGQARRLLALAAVREGKSRTEAAVLGAMDRQTLRDWVHRISNRIFESCDAICDCLCETWNSLIAENGRVQSIATRDWAVIDQSQ